MVKTEYETMYLGSAGHADIQKGLSKRQTKFIIIHINNDL
jgi:hypothetical protein